MTFKELRVRNFGSWTYHWFDLDRSPDRDDVHVSRSDGYPLLVVKVEGGGKYVFDVAEHIREALEEIEEREERAQT